MDGKADMDEATRSYSYRGPVGAASPAAGAMHEALELAMEDKSPFPDRSTFIDAGTPETGSAIRAAAEEGQHAVVVSPGGGTRVVSPEQALSKGRDAA